MSKEFFCDVAGCGRKLDPGEPFICKRHPGWRTCYYCNTPFDASGPNYPKGIVLTDWCCTPCNEKLQLNRRVEELDAENKRLRGFIEHTVLNYDPRSDIYATELHGEAQEALGRCRCCGQEECDEA